MKPVISVAEMQRVDAAADVAVDTLMDRAGYAVAVTAADMGATYGSTVRVLCGKGNNGGDGYVAARYLHQRGANVIVHHLGLPKPDSAPARAFDAAAAAGIRVASIDAVEPADVVIDALFGTGFQGELPPEAAPWTEAPAAVLAVDVPSGLQGDTGEASGAVFHADRTVTFHAYKPGHILGRGPDVCGAISVADIGLSGGEPVMGIVTDNDVVVPARARTDHKWRAGAVAIVGGMPGLTGAALLTARTALRSGAGVATILTNGATASAYETLGPDITTIQASETETWYDHAPEVLDLVGRYDVLVVGPGLEPTPPLFVDRLLEGFSGAVILDAGAFAGIERLATVTERTAPTILTPHAGEFSRLTDGEATADAAVDLAASTGSVVVLKGNPTFVAGSEVAVVTSGGPELATIGTGDVLAGMIGALVAMGVPAEEAARSGAYLHGVAGRRSAIGQTVVAPDLIDEVGRLIAERRMPTPVNPSAPATVPEAENGA